MSLISVIMNLVLAGLLLAALGMGVRLNRRLKALRDSQDGFATAVAELNAAAQRAEQGLADLRAATDEATDELADRIEKGRALAAKLERLTASAPEHIRQAPEVDRDTERRLGALLAAAREARGRPEQLVREEPRLTARPVLRPVPIDPDADLFEDEPLTLDAPFGGRR
jgi:ABC-type transporter Mla subunit MlaD